MSDEPAIINTAPDRHTLNGRAYVEALRDGLIPLSPMARTIGWQVSAVDTGNVTLTLTPRAEICNNRSVHGGALAAMIDAAMSAAVNSALPQGTRAVTQDLRTTFLASVSLEDGLLTIIGEVIELRRSLALAQARITNATGRLCAHGTGTFSLRSRLPSASATAPPTVPI